ncbi:M57 family metalloprotease [Dysgonomonas macrotermitis]|uniref:Dual-action HEIGH metallo-peptidase n=1 Tax=Dysgonomonas macrotermitis TaxID=1346286 RepID=A0A1M4ZCF0_9BACT|nr:M57 family metalloprotease [Dysgonomonas macrotermitis]SHF15691.1 Dual-action HEIGH metallo-peptidase [Dysgonomonas macrotermitis]
MKFIKPLCILLIVALVSACQNETIEDGNSPQTSGDISGDLALIKQLGMDITNIEDLGDSYVVEGDIILSKEQLRRHTSSSNDSLTLRQSRSTNLVSQANVSNISVGFDSSMPNIGSDSGWRDATQSAINEWNSIPGCLVKFTLTTVANPDIKIKYTTVSGTWVARALTPSNNKPGSYVEVNSTSNSYSSLEKKYAIVHELGHTLGLLHTDFNLELSETKSNNPGILIPGTPSGGGLGPNMSDNDINSIMNYKMATTWKGFSYYDVVAIRYLYPANSQISASSTAVGSGTDVTYTIGVNPLSSTQIKWESIQNATLTSGNGVSKATFKVSGNGYARVKAIVTFYGNNFSFEHSSVWIGKPATPTNIIGFETNNKIFNSRSQYSFTVAPANGATSYRWEVSGGTIIGTSTGASITVETAVSIGTTPKYLDVKVYSVNQYGESTFLYRTGTIKSAGDGPSIIL